MVVALTVDTFFALADALPFVLLSDLVGDGGLLVVAPHADDESLGCGGLLAICAAAGRTAHVVLVTDGVGSHTKSLNYPPDRLRQLRESELVDAIVALGLAPEDVTFLRAPDSHVPSNGSLSAELEARIVMAAEAVRASAIAVTWRHDPHCDHQASFVLAQRAAARVGAMLLEYPVWGHTLAQTTQLAAPPTGARIDITDALDRKRNAVAAHRSQTTRLIDDDPEGFMLSPEMLARFERPFEIFLSDR